MNSTIDRLSPADAKIRLFRALFRGREDIYARRFESRKTGKSGYAPACANEWVRGVCEKPRIKCAECPHRRFLAVTDDVIRWHLSGFNADDEPFVAGIYPLLLDEMCWFLAIDFDKSGWREDAAACLATSRDLKLPAALERSRSGSGAHLWFFFAEPIPAALARRLGSHVLTETMERRPQLGLDSYDRLFPNQDTMPQGGFGNLIALPLQKAPRDQRNSVFLDDDLEPHVDQWAYLARLRKLTRDQIERTVQEAERQGRVLGVRLPPQEDDEEDFPHHIALPRGCLDEVLRMLGDLGIDTTIRDERSMGCPLEVTFQGKLRPEQKVAADALLRHDTGVLAATTAFGKTVIGAWLIGERRVSTLVLVHRRQLLDQWIERLAMFLGMPVDAIGRIGGGRRRPTGLIDVAVMQSLVRKGVVDDSVAEYGQLIVDECHHLSARSFEQAARQAKARFIVGLSATVTRKDGHHPIIFMQCGPVRHRVDARTQAAARPFEHHVLVRPTTFLPLKAPEADKRLEFQALYQSLIEDDARTRRICEDIVDAVRAGRSPLVLTERNEHVDRLAQLLTPIIRHVVVLRAGVGKKQRDATNERLAAIPREEERVMISTGKYVGEGFDDPRLDTLFLTLPVSWRGTIAQYAGRLHRLYDGKKEVQVYDYADLNVLIASTCHPTHQIRHASVRARG